MITMVYMVLKACPVIFKTPKQPIMDGNANFTGGGPHLAAGGNNPGGAGAHHGGQGGLARPRRRRRRVAAWRRPGQTKGPRGSSGTLDFQRNSKLS